MEQSLTGGWWTMPEPHVVLTDLLDTVNRRMFECMREALHEHGLPVVSMIVLHHVREELGLTISDISRRTGIAKSHISNTVESLCQEGLLVKRQDASDQRLMRVFTTDRFDAYFRDLEGRIHQQMSTVMSAVPDDKVRMLIEGLRALRDVLDERVRPDRLHMEISRERRGLEPSAPLAPDARTRADKWED